jgi:hypothetical protein
MPGWDLNKDRTASIFDLRITVHPQTKLNDCGRRAGLADIKIMLRHFTPDTRFEDTAEDTGRCGSRKQALSDPFSCWCATRRNAASATPRERRGLSLDTHQSVRMM